MPSDRGMMLPAAIVVGSAIIGLSLYLGLREGLRREPVAPAPNAGPSPAPQATPTPPVSRAEPPADRAFRQAQAALDALRPGLVKTCWTPPLAGEPAAILLTYDITFAADGSILVLGISEQQDAYRTSVAECVRRQPRPVLPIDPPGEGVHVVLGLPMP